MSERLSFSRLTFLLPRGIEGNAHTSPSFRHRLTDLGHCSLDSQSLRSIGWESVCRIGSVFRREVSYVDLDGNQEENHQFGGPLTPPKRIFCCNSCSCLHLFLLSRLLKSALELQTSFQNFTDTFLVCLAFCPVFSGVFRCFLVLSGVFRCFLVLSGVFWCFLVDAASCRRHFSRLPGSHAVLGRAISRARLDSRTASAWRGTGRRSGTSRGATPRPRVQRVESFLVVPNVFPLFGGVFKHRLLGPKVSIP